LVTPAQKCARCSFACFVVFCDDIAGMMLMINPFVERAQ